MKIEVSSYSGLLSSVAIICLLTACHAGNQPVPLSCDASNTLFNQIYNDALQSASAREDTTMDANVHAYTFTVNSPATICKIGYRSMPQIAAKPYRIEIYDNTATTLVYSGSHVFSSTGTSYVAIAPVKLIAGNSYTIKRVQSPQAYLDDLLGRVIFNPSLPATKGNLTITGSSFYDRPGGTDSAAIDKSLLPYIDIVFQ